MSLETLLNELEQARLKATSLEEKCYAAVGSSSGKLYEVIVAKELSPLTMLPPCSNQDLPFWAQLVPHDRILDLIKAARVMREALEEACVCSNGITCVYCDALAEADRIARGES